MAAGWSLKGACREKASSSHVVWRRRRRQAASTSCAGEKFAINKNLFSGRSSMYMLYERPHLVVLAPEITRCQSCRASGGENQCHLHSCLARHRETSWSGARGWYSAMAAKAGAGRPMWLLAAGLGRYAVYVQCAEESINTAPAPCRVTLRPARRSRLTIVVMSVAGNDPRTGLLDARTERECEADDDDELALGCIVKYVRRRPCGAILRRRRRGCYAHLRRS